jgi:hypothetical protein
MGQAREHLAELDRSRAPAGNPSKLVDNPRPKGMEARDRILKTNSSAGWKETHVGVG